MANAPDRISRRRYQSTYVTTVVSMTLVLLMLGLLAMIILQARQLSDYVKENIGIRVYMKETSREADIIRLQKLLDAQPFVKSTKYVPPEEAARELTEELGEDFIDFLGYNPLPPSIDLRIRAEWATVDSLQKIEQDIVKDSNVKEVFYQKTLVELINRNIRTISVVLLGFSILLTVIAVVLIHNTIRLSVYSRRFLIRTMKLVGATQGFIRRPFVWRGIVQGLWGAILAIALLIVILYFSKQQLPELVSLYSMETFLVLFALVVFMGIAISWFSTFFAVRKYLKMNEDELYY
jgi:cell division transport system permease protein